MNEEDKRLTYKINYREEFKRYYRLYYNNSTLDTKFTYVNREAKNKIVYSSNIYNIIIIFYRSTELLEDLYFDFNRVLE